MFPIQNKGLTYYKFGDNAFKGTIHAVFSRKGGVSPSPWDSLNTGSTVGDSLTNVSENRKRIFSVLNRSTESIFDVWQIHSTDSVCTERPRLLAQPHDKADAIFTNNPNVTLLMRFADCVPIFIYDPKKRVVGLIHAGWKGTVNQIITKSLYAIKAKYNCNPAEIIAGIGPSIGPDHYSIGEDVVEKVLLTFKDAHSSVISEVGGKKYFNLWTANEQLLIKSGITHILRADICTACDLEHWYSHRAEKGETGRFAAVIALDQ